ncbi:hypothetical protein BV22DRAFT_1128866 [Leucogyrophana mollusca]|uniref:Uncharacterized protein n=1 Tax=Leucogyrophana mollusca TaxID=85980 RepID=A0ACB8BIV4_9AGAM|nr:hypothetical protein BV22DRAFT_1128866 [Leucogyrophana mollusca]
MYPSVFDVASIISSATEPPSYYILSPQLSSMNTAITGATSTPHRVGLPPSYTDDIINTLSSSHIQPLPREPNPNLELQQPDSENEARSVPRSPLCPTEHVYSPPDNRQAWVTLRLNSMARSANQVPAFISGVEICGSVDFDLRSGNTIQSATLTLTGRILSGDVNLGSHLDVRTFLDQRQVMTWSTAEFARTSGLFVSRKNGSPSGKFTCPFVFTIPEEFYLTYGPLRPYTSPPSFVERLVGSMVRYELKLRVKKGKFNSPTKIRTVINFTPLIRPDPPSLLRQISYQEHSPLLGPDQDPDGWHTLPAVGTAGRIFNDRNVEVKCTLSLAKPLCYPRGSILPFHVVLHSDDEQALDLLASSQALDIRLRRAVGLPSQISLREGSEGALGFRHTNMTIQSAVLWPSTLGNEHFTRHFEGEIPLASDLKPSAHVEDFVIAYSIMLLPFKATAFASRDSGPLLKVPIKIATAFPEGPRPRSFAPLDQGEMNR